MASPWLVLDVDYLCFRAYYALQEQIRENRARAVTIGGLHRVLGSMMDLFCTTKVVFCFDCGIPLRRKLYPEYKRHRDQNRVIESHQQVRDGIDSLRRNYLPNLGYKNVFSQEGYEADDVIAAVCQNLAGEAIIISADRDLYQLLSPRVLLYNPNVKTGVMTEALFIRTYGITPKQWVDVKAIAGCPTDNVVGVRGIGEVLAAKFLAGKLKESSRPSNLIRANREIWERNLPLVSLPYEGIKVFLPREERVLLRNWDLPW